MEPDMNRAMETTRPELQSRIAWEIGHKMIGMEKKLVYSALIRKLNQSAKQAGKLPNYNTHGLQLKTVTILALGEM